MRGRLGSLLAAQDLRAGMVLADSSESARLALEQLAEKQGYKPESVS